MILLIATVCLFLPVTWATNKLDVCPDPPYNNIITKQIVFALESLRPCLLTGIPDRNIPPLDPFEVPKNISFDIDNEYISLEGIVQDTTIYNLAMFIICEITVKLGVRQRLYAEFRFDSLKMEGFYDMDGVITSLFPLFGSGMYRLESFNLRFSLAATIKFNVFTSKISVSNLDLQIHYKELQLYMECILGCGFMADTANKYLGDLADSIFTNVWKLLKAGIEEKLEKLINEFLADTPSGDFPICAAKKIPTEFTNPEKFRFT